MPMGHSVRAAIFCNGVTRVNTFIHVYTPSLVDGVHCDMQDVDRRCRSAIRASADTIGICQVQRATMLVLLTRVVLFFLAPFKQVALCG